jgi:hypothetical protein
MGDDIEEPRHLGLEAELFHFHGLITCLRSSNTRADMSDPAPAFKRALYRPAGLCDRWRRRKVNQTLASGEGDRMGCTRQRRRTWLRALIIGAAMMAAVDASGDGPEAPNAADGQAARAALVGEYRHSSVFTAGKTRRSVATIAPRGAAGFSLSWEEDEGNLFGGIGISLDGVFGAAYTEALNGSFRGKGVLAYRINGGTLDGIRLPSDSADGTLIRETLEGSPALEGRYAIARSLDSDGRTYHSGYVDIVHHGDTYQMTWYTPAHSFDGVGLRVGNVLIAGYARGFAPGVLAYCADKGLLTGIVTFGHVGTIGTDLLKRVNRGSSEAAAEPSAFCRDAIDRWNPSLSGVE